MDAIDERRIIRWLLDGPEHVLEIHFRDRVGVVFARKLAQFDDILSKLKKKYEKKKVFKANGRYLTVCFSRAEDYLTSLSKTDPQTVNPSESNLPPELRHKCTGEPLKLLEYLVEHEDATNDELLKNVWSEKIGYDYTNINRNIALLKVKISGSGWVVDSSKRKKVRLYKVNKT